MKAEYEFFIILIIFEASGEFYNRMNYYFNSNKILAISFVSPGSSTQFQIDVGCHPRYTDYNDKIPAILKKICPL